MGTVKRYGMLRDNQVAKLYKAEKVLDGMSNRLETVADMEKFVKRMCERATIKRRYANEIKRPIKVGDGRMRQSAGGDQWGIYMPRWSRTEWIVLHELAHTLSHRKYGRSTIAPHGWQFAAIYLDLVRFCMSKEAADILKASFREHRVKYKAPRQRLTA